MRLVVQRVKNAKVEVKNKIVGQIKQGYMVLVGVGPNDTEKEVDYLAKKLINLRVFEDEKWQNEFRAKRYKWRAFINISIHTICRLFRWK